MTQVELAEAIKTTSPVLSKWERGVSLPSIEDANRICEFFGVTTEYLIKGIISQEDKRTLERSLSTGEMADDYIKKCNQIIKGAGLQEYKETLLPKKEGSVYRKNPDNRGGRNAYPYELEYIDSIVGGVFGKTRRVGNREVVEPISKSDLRDCEPRPNPKSIIAVDNYLIYEKFAQISSDVGEYKIQRDDIKGKNDIRFYQKFIEQCMETKTQINAYRQEVLVNDVHLLSSVLGDLDPSLPNYWEIVILLIDNGAFIKKLIEQHSQYSDTACIDDLIMTNLLYETAKLKIANK